MASRLKDPKLPTINEDEDWRVSRREITGLEPARICCCSCCCSCCCCCSSGGIVGEGVRWGVES